MPTPEAQARTADQTIVAPYRLADMIAAHCGDANVSKDRGHKTRRAVAIGSQIGPPRLRGRTGAVRGSYRGRTRVVPGSDPGRSGPGRNRSKKGVVEDGNDETLVALFEHELVAGIENEKSTGPGGHQRRGSDVEDATPLLGGCGHCRDRHEGPEDAHHESDIRVPNTEYRTPITLFRAFWQTTSADRQTGIASP
jgi:hypothetical protein